MKKITKIAVALLLVASLLLCMVACGEDEGKALVGTWTSEINISDALKESFDQAGQDISVDAPFILSLVFTFGEDGSAELYIDEEATLASAASYSDALSVALEDIMYAEAEAAGMTREQFDAIMAEQGMSVQELCAQTAGELVKEMETSLSGQETFIEGYYTAKDGKLYLEEEKEDLRILADNSAADYVLEGNTLSMDISNAMGEDDMDDLQELEELGLDLTHLVFVKD